MNGKGDKPRNCYSKQFKNNYDEINWNNNSESNFNDSKETNGEDKRNIQDLCATEQERKET